MMRWDDLRYFLAVARGESLSRAALALHVDHSTVVRRLLALENSLQTRLFRGVGRARELTAAGRDLLVQAERLEAAMRAIELDIARRDLQNAGTIKVSTPDGIAVVLMPELIVSFHRANPDIRIEIITSNTPLDLIAREADIELRPTRRPMREARGRKLGRIAFGLYGARRYRSRQRTPPRATSDAEWVRRFDWILPDPVALPIYAPADWMRAAVPQDRVVATVSSAVVMLAMVEQGLGVAALPCYLAAGGRGVERLMLLDEGLWGELWLLTHPELSRTARVRAFLDHASDFFATRRHLLDGRETR
jgi:DNA-binding transcriptional LysR family regulator